MPVMTAVLGLLAAGAVGVAGVLLVLAPGEIVSLVAGWDRRNPRLPATMPYYVDVQRPYGATVQPARYLVYLDGIGKSAPRNTRVARELIRQLADVLPGTRFVGHVTPYSPSNRPLGSHPRLGFWWRLAMRRFRVLVMLRNIAQTLVACDRRYQRAYHAAVAETVVDHLRASGYRAGSGVPVVLLGYSGGAEVAVGIAARIAEALHTPPITVVSIGGVFDARSALPGVEHLYHFRSRNDWVERLAALAFPARWPILAHSGWNVARRAGRISIHRLDGARHCGRRGYLSSRPVLPGGESQLGRTLRAVAAVLRPRTVVSSRAPSGGQADGDPARRTPHRLDRAPTRST